MSHDNCAEVVTMTESLSSSTQATAGPVSYVDVLQGHVDAKPDAHAYSFLRNGETVDERLTYRELQEQVIALAVRLQACTQPGDRVALMLDSDLHYLRAFLACLHAGVIAVTIHPPTTGRHLDRLDHVFDDAEPTVIMATLSVRDRFADKTSRLCAEVHPDWLCVDEQIEVDRSTWKRPDHVPGDLAFLQYTSGSTSAPKGVMVTHANMLHQARLMESAFGLNADDKLISWLPHFHDMGLFFGVLEPLFLGVPGYLMTPIAFIKRPVRFLRAISEHRCTASIAPNFSFDLCVESAKGQDLGGLDLSCWTIAANGAEPVRWGTLERFAETFEPYGFRFDAHHPAYGMAETTLVVSSKVRGRRPTRITARQDALRNGSIEPAGQGIDLVSCGPLWPDFDIRITDPESRESRGTNQTGEILLRSSSVTAGYWRNAAATEEAYGVMLSDGEGPFFATGDIGFVDMQGELHITGRAKDVIVIRGTNHYPQDIELTVEEALDAVRPSFVAAFNVDHDDGEGFTVVAEIRRDREAGFDAAKAAKTLSARIFANHEIRPERILFVRRGKFPKTTSGKVERRRCRVMVAAGEFDEV